MLHHVDHHRLAKDIQEIVRRYGVIVPGPLMIERALANQFSRELFLIQAMLKSVEHALRDVDAGNSATHSGSVNRFIASAHSKVNHLVAAVEILQLRPFLTRGSGSSNRVLKLCRRTMQRDRN